VAALGASVGLAGAAVGAAGAAHAAAINPAIKPNAILLLKNVFISDLLFLNDQLTS
jgi:hypothetical protein